MENKIKLQLKIQNGGYGVCKLSVKENIPDWTKGNFISITRTDEELSIVCEEKYIPGNTKCEKGWKCLKVMGPLDFSLIGILSALTRPLAIACISIFAISTFDTDYLLIKKDMLKKAVEVLSNKGHIIL